MKFLVTTFICVLRVLVFVQSEQLYEKFEEAFCKLQCSEKGISPSSACSNANDCECNHELIPNLGSISMTAYGKSNPNVECKSDNMVFVEWNDDFNPFDRNNTTVYFLHVKSSNDEFFTDVISCHYDNIRGLNPNTSYSISLWGVDDAQNVFVSKSLNVKTNEKITPLPVANISIKLKPEAKYYEGDLMWIPATDLSCFYEIVVLRMDFSFPSVDEIPQPKKYDIIPTSELFTLHIDKLEFGYLYDVMIKSRGSKWKNKSEAKRYSFRIPTCLEAHKNLTICAPPKPKNFTIMETLSSNVNEGETDLFDIHLEWLKPSLIPDYYIAELVILNTTHQVTHATNMTIPGDKNMATFREMNINASYQVFLQAISSGGKSVRASNHRFIIQPNGLGPTSYGKKKESQPSPYFQIGNTVNILVGMISILLVFGISSFLMFYTRRDNSKKKKMDEKEFIENQCPKLIFTHIVEPDKWEIPLKELHFKYILGEGHFGVVWKAFLGEIPVACKILKENSTIDEIRQLQQEIEIMKNVGTHPNIVSMIGCVTQNVTNGPILVVEYCSMGNLLTYLRSIYDHTSKICRLKGYHEDVYHGGSQLFINKSYELNFSQTKSSLSLSHKDVLSFASQIALGMEYLSNQKIVHRDLAARNILISEDKILKVSDFGLSRDVYINSIYYKKSYGKLPLRWMALESLTHQIYSSQSDVWSFGVLLWEIVSLGGIPYPGVEAENLTKMLKQGFRMTKPPFCLDEVYSIMADCWKDSPDDRPTFSALKEACDALLVKWGDYLEVTTIT